MPHLTIEEYLWTIVRIISSVVSIMWSHRVPIWRYHPPRTPVENGIVALVCGNSNDRWAANEYGTNHYIHPCSVKELTSLLRNRASIVCWCNSIFHVTLVGMTSAMGGLLDNTLESHRDHTWYCQCSLAISCMIYETIQNYIRIIWSIISRCTYTLFLGT